MKLIVISVIMLLTSFTRLVAEDKKEIMLQMITTIDKTFKVPQVSAEEVKNHINEYVIVDVRDIDEQKVSMIKGAITVSEFMKNKAKYKQKKIIAYCTIGYRSSGFAQNLKSEGFDAYNLEGSLIAWSYAGGKVYNDRGETNKIHVYGKKWDLLAPGYESVGF